MRRWEKIKSETRERIHKIRKSVLKVFPHFSLELSVSMGILVFVFLSVILLRTAKTGQDMGGEYVYIDSTVQTTTGSETERFTGFTPIATEATTTVPSETTTASSETVDFEMTPPPIEEQVIEYLPSQMCFIGDSRVYAMETTGVTKDVRFIAKSAEGLDWFINNATPEFDLIADDIEICLVALGINDLWNLDEYIETLNAFADKYPDKIFVYANIGPVDETLYTGIPNRNIERFNKDIQAGLSDRWQILDQYEHLSTIGFGSSDGLHYAFQDVVELFMWTVDEIKTQTLVPAE